MPSIFKALASIAAWVLFVFGLGGLAVGVIVANYQSGGILENFPVKSDIELALFVVTVFLSVVVMRLRKTLE